MKNKWFNTTRITEGEKNTLILKNNANLELTEIVEILEKNCHHTENQALQCAYLLVLKGEIEILKGKSNQLIEIQEKLRTLGLDAYIKQ